MDDTWWHLIPQKLQDAWIWIWQERSWLFSGVGVVVMAALLQWFVKRRNAGSQPPDNKPLQAPQAPPLPISDDEILPGPTAGQSRCPLNLQPPPFTPNLTRSADHAVRRLAQRSGLTLVIKGPEETGKSRLLTGYLAECRSYGKAHAYIDFSSLSSADLDDYAGLLSLLALMLQDALGQATGDPPNIASQYVMNQFMDETLLPRIPGPLALGFDEVDRILGRPYQEDFFSMLRSWHNNRNPLKPRWRRLDLALVISTEPYLLIDDDARSPFNVGEIIELSPFTLQEYRALNLGYGGPLTPAEVERLWTLLGGQPRLTHIAFARLTGPERIGIQTLLDTAYEQHGPFGAHLRKLSAKLRKAPELRGALTAIIRHGALPERTLCDRLYGAGLVRWEHGRVLAASELYAGYFAAAD